MLSPLEEPVSVEMGVTEIVLQILASLVIVHGQFAYQVPVPVIEALSPRGIRVSIPDEEGIELLAFHGNINKPLIDIEAGELSRDVIQKTGDRWVYLDYRPKLKVGDVIRYWLFVIKNRLGYRYDHGKFIVQGK